METGIKSDGSLTQRKKGDLFWKKYKLYKQSEMEHGSSKKSDRNLFMGEVLAEYEDVFGVVSGELDGHEFSEYPPTATGREVKRAAIVRAMRKRDEMQNTEDDSNVLFSALCNAIAALFAMIGIDEKTGKRTPIEDLDALEDDFEEKRKAYEDAFFADKENQELKAPAKTFERKRLKPSEFKAFEEYIPGNYLGQLRNGTMMADAYYDGDVSEENFAALMLWAVHEGWKEIIWMSFDDDVKGNEEKTCELLNYVLYEAKEQGEFLGVFKEFHSEEFTGNIERGIGRLGFSVRYEKNNVYECRLSDLVEQATVMAAVARVKCSTVENTDEDTMDGVERRIASNKQPVPVSVPVPWENYRADLSFTCLNRAADEAGLLLVSEIGDSLVLDLVYGSNPIIVAALIGNAIKKAKELLPADQKVLIPIVNTGTVPLIEKMVPTATRGEIAETILWF